MNLYEVRYCGGRLFCLTDLAPVAPEGTGGEVRHYTAPMVGVVEVEGRWCGCRFVMRRDRFEEGRAVTEASTGERLKAKLAERES